MKKLRVIAAAALICLLLAGCAGLSLNGTDILAPPRAQGNQAQIQKLIQSTAGKSYEMIYPEYGEYKSSVIFTNLDGDSDDEAIAMYSSEKNKVQILIADKSGGGYDLIGSCEIASGKLDQIEFADFNGSGRPEILVSYPGTTAALRSATVITIGGEVARYDMTDVCAAHIIGDFNGDGRDDLLTVGLANGETLPTARLLVGNSESLVEQSSCEIASDAKEYVSLCFGRISDGISGAVIDAKNADGAYTTQLICYDYNVRGLVNPLYVNNSYAKTRRTALIASADIDRDGVIEVPLCSVMAYAQNEESSAVCDRIDWSSYDYSHLTLVTKQSAILCDRLGFLLNLPPEHADIVTARYIGENAMSVYLWEYKRTAPERTTKLLTVKRYSRSGFDDKKVLEAIAGKDQSYVYTYVIETENGFYGYTDDEVTDNFVIIEDR